MIPSPFNKDFPTIDIDNPSQGFRDNWEQIEIAIDGKLNVNGTDPMTGPLVLASDPTLDLHAATKQYVDAIATGLDVKKSVRVATTVNISLTGTQTIDTIGLNAEDRVLVKNQTDSKENGIYDVSSSGWSRSSDADNSPIGEVTSGMFTFIEEGSLSGTGWVLTTADPIVLGMSNLIFSQFSDATVVISSVFGRIGAVVAVSGDYTASEITNVPAGNIAAITVQTALNELDSEKATTEQGTLADSSLQSGDNISVLVNDSGYVTTSGLINVVEDLTPQLGGELDAQNNKIINLVNPTSAQDAATKDYIDTNFTSSAIDFLPLTGGTLSGDLTTSGNYSVTSDGSAASPAFRRSGTGSGMYFAGGDVRISVGSLDQITVSPTLTIFLGNVDIIGEPLFLPSGAEGQIFFNNSTGTRSLESDFTVIEGRFVDTAQELVDALLIFFTFADVFNTWYRFSHDATLTFPAIPAETTAWSFDSGTDQISSTINSVSYIGLVSNDFFNDYVFEAQMSSINADDDAISIVLAFTTEGTFGEPGYKEFTLNAIRTMGGLGTGGNEIWQIIYNYKQADEFIVADGSSTLTQWFKSDGSSGLGNQGWVDAGIGVPMKADRIGDIITVSTGEANTTVLLPITDLVIDLSSDIRLDKFRGQVRLGFGALSQDAATWSDVNLVLSDNIIYDLATGDVYVFDGTVFAVVPGKNLIDDIGFGRIITNPDVGKSWFIDREGNTPYVSNSSFGTTVTSVFGRNDAIVAVAGDYTAAQITNTPAGNIMATDVQVALNELDSEKATSAQGTLADSALQSGDNISVLTNDSGYITSLPSISIGSLSDVDVTGLINDDILQWDGTNFIPKTVFEVEKLLISSLGTGWIDGGIITINVSTSTVDISAGNGLVINNVDPNNPTITKVSWSAFINEPVLNLATQNITWFSIDSSGSIVKTNVEPSSSQFRDIITLAAVSHESHVAIDSINLAANPVFDVSKSLHDFANAFGNITLDGLVFSANGANLIMDRNAGSTFNLGSNAQNNPKDPNILVSSGVTALTFVPFRTDGVGGFTSLTPTTNIDPNSVDLLDGTLGSVPGNRFTIQRLYFVPHSGTHLVQYGSVIYMSIIDAMAAIDTEDTPQSEALAGTRRGWLIVQGGTTDLTTVDESKFISADKFGINVSGIAAGINAVIEDLTPALGGELDAQTNKIINLGTPTASADAATKAYVDGISVAPIGLIEDFHGFMEAPTDKTFVLMLIPSYGFNVTQIDLQLGSGTLSAQLRVNNVLVGPVHSVTSTLLSNSTIINVPSGQKVELVITSSATSVDFAFSIERTRT